MPVSSPPLTVARLRGDAAMLLIKTEKARAALLQQRSAGLSLAERRALILSDGKRSRNDLIGLQQYWGGLVPDAEFVSPDAPFPCDMAPYGYQWFSVQDRSPPAVLAGDGKAASACS